MTQEFETERAFILFNDPDTEKPRVIEVETALPRAVNVYTYEELHNNRKKALELLRTSELPEAYKEQFEWVEQEDALVGEGDLQELKDILSQYKE